jgi:hypothetical protein
MNKIKHHSTSMLSKASKSIDGGLDVTSKPSEDQEKKFVKKEIFPDYPSYPPEEDIYSKYTEEQDIDPEQPSMLKEPVILSELDVQLDFRKEVLPNELDVPGAELDDQQELLGSEDEENNYYSLGGDDHEDLDETNIEGV